MILQLSGQQNQGYKTDFTFGEGRKRIVLDFTHLVVAASRRRVADRPNVHITILFAVVYIPWFVLHPSPLEWKL